MNAKAKTKSKAEPAWFSDEDYAAHRGVSRLTIQRALKAGLITRTSRGIHGPTADASWSRSPRGRPKGSKTQRPEPGPDDPPTPPKVSKLQRAETLAKIAKAKATVLEYRRKRRDLVERDVVRSLLATFAGQVRERLERLPARVQDALAAECRCRKCGGEIEVKDVGIALDDVVRESLEHLATDPTGALKARPKRKSKA